MSDSPAPPLQSPVPLHIRGTEQISAHPSGPGSHLLFPSRRAFLKSLSRSALVLQRESIRALARPRRLWARSQADQEADMAKNSAAPSDDVGVTFLNVARESGLNVKTIFGGEHKNKYLLETTGCGVAFYDYDNDGWLDIFLVNGSRLEGFPASTEPTSHLFRNNRDGTFTAG